MIAVEKPLLSSNEVAELYQVTGRTIRRWAAEGSFPKPIRLGDKCYRWRRAEVEQFKKHPHTNEAN